MDKVKNFCDHSTILWEMAGDLLTSGHFWTPPASFRVKIQTLLLAFYVHLMDKMEKSSKILGNCFADFLHISVPKGEKLLFINQKASISNYICHAIKYSCSKELVLKSLLDSILQSRSLCSGVKMHDLIRQKNWIQSM